MDTCADLVCVCGNHECVHKHHRNVIKPIVYKSGLPLTEHQEEYRKYAYEPPVKSMKPISQEWTNEAATKHPDHLSVSFPTKTMLKPCLDESFRNVHLPNCRIQHPTHTHEANNFCHDSRHCCECISPEATCGHGPYIPKTSSTQKPVCHPDRPNVVEVSSPLSEIREMDCSKCSEIFSPIRKSFSEKQPPTKRMEETLEDCHELCKSHCGHAAEIEGCCCRCCTCRGCPSCKTEFCHPCNFTYGREKTATHCTAINKFPLNSSEEGQPCEKHPCGCYFVPNVNE